MEAIKRRPVYKDYVLIILGTFLLAVSITSVFEPIGLVTGGVTGLGIIVQHITGGIMPLSLFNILANIPLLLAALKMKGAKFLSKTVAATVLLSIFLSVLPVVPNLPQDKLLLTIFGGVMAGTGTGLVFVALATTGGTDLLALLLFQRYPHISVSNIMGMVDGVIVLIGALVFGLANAMYALIAIFIISQLSDRIMEGMKFAKLAFIISNDANLIGKTVMDNMERGVTRIGVEGLYTNEEKSMLMCVVAKKEIVGLKEIVRGIDPGAFLIVSDVREAVGEGFLEYHK